ncbi:MAG: LysR family transcriptional regulator [Rhodoferax sp.]|uniref:LysR family transcriptional regulator n=1 Tax=Rhodoferax sp. TaxID=50421 RepID=UPI003267435B
MQTARDVLTPDALSMLVTIHAQGSFAAAARSLGMVPSALTYRVRNIEDALDVLLFDRSSRQAKLTVAGSELLREGQRLLEDIDAVANRVKRVATGWEPQLTIAMDSVISRATMMELCEAFFALNPPTRLKIREEVLHGTLDALVTGLADVAIGVAMDTTNSNILGALLGEMHFIFVVAPHHPLANMPEPLSDSLIQQYRAVAVADSTQRGNALTFGLLGGQDVFTVPNMRAKLEAQLRGLGCGFLPEGLARPYLETGRLVSRSVERPSRVLNINYAWRTESGGGAHGRALQWWLQQLKSPATRAALLERQQSN